MRARAKKKAAELLLFLSAAGLLLLGCGGGKEGGSGKMGKDEPITENAAILYNPQSSSYDETAEARRQEILAMPDTIKDSAKGTIYYVSTSGNDENDGLTEETAWKTPARAGEAATELQAGDAVLFERGGVYRGTVALASGVSYGAYGEGPKPCIYGSLKNYASEDLWQSTDREHIWKLSVGEMSDIGNIVFNHGKACGMKRLEDTLRKDFDFYHDIGQGELYLYLSDGNPGAVYEDIEICSNDHIMNGIYVNYAHDILFENLCLKYTGAHGICFKNGTNNITVRGCEIGYIGGSMLDQSVRYGNGFEVVDNCYRITVTDNWVYQCYDAGITHQSSYQPGCVQQEINFSNNLIEYCNYNIEYYVSQQNGRIEDAVYENNILRFAGYGFGSVNRIGSDTSVVSDICCYVRSIPCNNFVIRGNVMDSSLRFHTTIGCPNDTENNLGPVIEGNTYIQQGNEVALILTGGARRTLWADSQESLEESIRLIDMAPASVIYE